MTAAPGLSKLGWRAPLGLRFDLRRLRATVDRDGFDAARAGFADWPEAYQSKYWDLSRHLARNLHRARRLGLHRAPRGLKVLDLGTGCGYFPLVCGFYGHDAIGTDVDDSNFRSVFREIAAVLGVERCLSPVQPLEPLPDFGRTFDLVTGFAVLFNKPEHGQTWGLAEWRHLLIDLASRQLRPQGRIFFELVQDRSGRYYDDRIAGLFQAAGARVRGREIYFHDCNTARSLGPGT